MTFGVSRDQGTFEWAGTSLAAIFCQPRNIFSRRMWRLIFDIIRFNQFSLDVLLKDGNGDEAVGEYLNRNGYSDAFRDDYLIPMTAAIWSTSPGKCIDEFPLLTLVRFL
jgi:predicted NAD/FAD-binding protein